jgi:hypothetical protein
MARVLRCRHQQCTLPFCETWQRQICRLCAFDNVGTTGPALTDVLDDFFSSRFRKGAPWTSQLAVSHGEI